MRRLVGRAALAVISLIVCATCGPSEHAQVATSSGGEAPSVLPSDAWNDVVVGAYPRRVRPTRSAAADDASARAIERPGELEVLIGRRGDGHLVPGVTLDESGAPQLPERDTDWYGSGTIYDEEQEREVPVSRMHVVIDVPYESWAGEGTFVHLLALSPTLAPAAGAEVFLDGRHVGTTEAHGTLAFRRRPSEGEQALGGRLDVRWRGQERTVAYEAGARTSSFEATTIYASTDRGIFDPGDTIHVRAIAWRLRGEYEPRHDAELEVQLLDPEERIVGGGLLRTDDWGIGELAIPVPSSAREGAYTLVAISGEERTEAPLVVQRFVAPAIEMQHDLPRFVTPRTPALAAHVSLRYFDGAPFERGRLELVARVLGAEIARVTRDVEGPGPHELALGEAELRHLLRAAQQHAHLAQPIELVLACTDATERRDEIRRYVRFAHNPYTATIELDRTRYAAGDPVRAMVRIVDLDAIPARDREVVLDVPVGRGRGWQGTEAQRERLYDAQDRGTEASTRRQLRARTDAGGVARFAFDMPWLDEEFDDAGISASLDDADSIASTELPFSPPVPMRSAVDDTVVRAGDDVDVEILFPTHVSPVESVVHADVVDSSGAIIHSALIPVRGRSARGTFRAPSWGSMLLTLWCVGRSGGQIGLVSDGQNLVVHPGDRISVTLGGLPASASPGERVGASIQVTDASGAPRDAVLGVSMVDAAVLSMLDPLERTPFDRFYNPERKVLATTGSQTLTWPVVSRTWGDERVDIGWPETFGWHGGPLVREQRRLRRSASMGGGGGGGLAEILAGGAVTGSAADVMAQAGGMGLGSLGTVGHGAGSGSGSGYGAGAGGFHGRGGEPEEPEVPEPPPTTIVLRTDFDETSLWLSRVLTERGRAAIDVELPDAITEQALTVIASDREGGIATARVSVPVRQSLFVRGDLPAALTEGDRASVGVAVRNAGEAEVRVAVRLEASGLEVIGDAQTIVVPAGGTGVARFEVRATRAGTATWRAVGEAPGLTDIEERTLFVHPRGAPIVSGEGGAATRDQAFTTRFVVADDDRYAQARIRVVMPTVAPAMAGLEHLATDGYFGPDPAASRALAISAVHRWLVSTDRLDEATRLSMCATLSELAGAMAAAQSPDGGWGWFWDARSVPYISAYALHALIELSAEGAPVDPGVLERAARFLLGSIGSEHLLGFEAIAPWEGGSRRVRVEATAQVIDVLSRLPAALRDRLGVAAVASTVIEAMEADIAAADASPLLLASAAGAMHRLGLADAARIAELAHRLADVRHTVHWEPGWFSMWGGTIEAAAVALELLAEIDPGGYESLRRDAIRFVLHTRGSWGAWHNARSTAWAIRALMLVEPGDPADEGELSVRLDGREIRRVHTRASELFTAALAMREIDPGPLPPGEHVVEVSYGGSSRARVEVELSRWPASAEASATAETASALELSRSVEPEVRRGRPFEVALTLRSRAGSRVVTLEQPLAAGLEVDRSALDRQREEGVISAWETRSGTLRIGLLTGAEERALSVRLVPTRTGELELPAATAATLDAPEQLARSAVDRIAVR